jgi:hypothetical protein
LSFTVACLNVAAVRFAGLLSLGSGAPSMGRLWLGFVVCELSKTCAGSMQQCQGAVQIAVEKKKENEI